MADAPDTITNLKEYLWYIRANESLILVTEGDKLVSLKSLGHEEWAATVSRWILNYQIPAALEPLSDEERAAVERIENPEQEQ